MACGLPVVGSNEGGLPEFINSSVGTLVSSNDEDAFCGAILEELAHSREAPERRAFIARYARENFAQELFVAKLKSHKEHIRCHREVIKQPRYHKRKAEYTDNGADSEKDDESDVLFDSRQFQRQHVYHLVIHAENHHHSSAAYTRYNICHAEYDTVNDIQ